ncbi:MAG: hypothetical protein QW224_02680 [Desulfurococcaceae archaeon]
MSVTYIMHCLHAFLHALMIMLLIPYTASTFNYSFYLVVRRVSYFTCISLPEVFTLVLQVVSMLVLLTAVFKGVEARSVKKALCKATPSAIVVVAVAYSSRYLLLLALVLSLAELLHEAINDYVDRLLTLYTISAFFAASTIAQITALMGVQLLYLVNLANYVWGVLQPITPYFYLSTLSLSLIVILKNFNNDEGLSQQARVSLSELAYVALGAMLSVLFYVTPYTWVVNPRGFIATTDIVYYSKWLSEMTASGDPIGFAASVNSGDRPLYLLLLYCIKVISGRDEWFASTISGWMWAPLLTLSTWYMARELYGVKVGRITALITPMSHQAMAFIYGGFQANQLNLALIYLAIGLLAKPLLRRVIASALVLFASLYIHAWSWLQVVPAIGLWIVAKAFKGCSRRSLVPIAAVLTSITLSIALRYQVILSMLQYSGSMISVEGASTSLEAKLLGLSNTFSFYIWGALGIPLVHILALIAQALRIKGSESIDVLDYLNLTTLVEVLAFAHNVSFTSRICLNTPIHLYSSKITKSMSTAFKIAVLIMLLNTSIYMSLNAAPKP